MIPALVLTAGLATRLRPLSLVRAKAALPVAGDPLVRRILLWLAGYGIADAVLNLHHLPHTITRIIGEGTDEGVRVRYSWEVPVLGSAGGPRRALPLLGSSTFLIVNGDTLTNANVEALVDDHRRSGALVTMAVVPNLERRKYGSVVVDPGGAVTGFTRAARAALEDERDPERAHHFIGVQVAEAEAFASLSDGVPAESVAELYPALIAQRPGAVRAFISPAEFFDIGTPGDYLNTSLLLGSRESGLGIRSADSDSRLPTPDSRLLVGARTHLAGDALIEDSVVWDDVDVQAGVRLHRCIVTDGVRIPAGTSWESATMRVALGDLMPTERLVGELAVGSIG